MIRTSSPHSLQVSPGYKAPLGDTSDDPDITTTFTAGFYFDIEHTLQAQCVSFA
jgi:hypothetical protein